MELPEAGVEAVDRDVVVEGVGLVGTRGGDARAEAAVVDGADGASDGASDLAGASVGRDASAPPGGSTVRPGR